MFTNTASTANASTLERTSVRVMPAPAITAGEATDSSTDWLAQWNGPVTATATAVCALVLSEQHGSALGEVGAPSDIDSAYQGDLSELIVGSMHWLARRQHSDGGWSSCHGDLEMPSNLATSMIVQAAFQLTGAPAAYPTLVDQMTGYIKQQGGCNGLKDQFGPLHNATLLTQGCSALAQTTDWRQLPAIAIERAAFDNNESSSDFWLNRQPVLPAIVALGIASFALHKPINPLTNWRRAQAFDNAIDWLTRIQSDNGGFSDSVPVTSLVLMSLASVGRTSGTIVRRGVEYLFGQVGIDGNWPGDAGCPNN